jgi:hypothetical protein
MQKVTVYLQEVETQIKFAKVAYVQFEAFYANKEIANTFMTIHHFPIHISNIDKILDVTKNSFRKSILGSYFQNVDLKQFRKMRNHLEHFDERMDDWIKNHDGHTFFDMNFITGTKGFPDKVFLRVLDGYILKFYGESYNLQELKLKLQELEEALKKIQY